MTLPGQSDMCPCGLATVAGCYCGNARAIAAQVAASAAEMARELGLWLPAPNVGTQLVLASEHARYRMALEAITLPEVGSSFGLANAIAALALRSEDA